MVEAKSRQLLQVCMKSGMWDNICGGGKEQAAAAAHLISCPGHTAGFINEGEHGKGGVDRGSLQ